MLKVDSATAGSSRDAPAMLSLLEHDQIRRDYFRWFDHYARLVYTEAPDALPAEPRALFEELWAWHALHERGWIGGAVPAAFLRLRRGRVRAGADPAPSDQRSDGLELRRPG